MGAEKLGLKSREPHSVWEGRDWVTPTQPPNPADGETQAQRGESESLLLKSSFFLEHSGSSSPPNHPHPEADSPGKVTTSQAELSFPPAFPRSPSF